MFNRITLSVKILSDLLVNAYNGVLVADLGLLFC